MPDKLTYLKNHTVDIVHQAQIDKPSYIDYTINMLGKEVEKRRETDYLRRLKMAGLPDNHDLDYYDFTVSNGMSKPELQQLREMVWLEQNFNVVFIQTK